MQIIKKDNIMHGNLPQLVYLAMSLMGMGLAMARHGQPKTGKNNFWSDIFITAIIFYILYSGGFFDGLLGL